MDGMEKRGTIAFYSYSCLKIQRCKNIRASLVDKKRYMAYHETIESNRNKIVQWGTKLKPKPCYNMNKFVESRTSI